MVACDIKAFCSEDCDVLVVGGGIHGAAIAFHAARAGFRTALVEKGDFCSATSANSLKILHGGLRYLQHLDVARMRQSITSRRELMNLDPGLVEPLACLMPLYGRGVRGREVMRTALLLNDGIGWDRNRGLPADIHLPSGHLLSREECRRVVPGIEAQGLRGGAVWYDALAVNTERLVLEYILKCLELGGRAMNYLQFTGFEDDGKGGYCVFLLDTITRKRSRMHCRYIINAAGPWFDRLIANTEKQIDVEQSWALALNLITPRKMFNDYAVALEGQSVYRDADAFVQRGKRLYFFVPWRGATMIGTSYEACFSGPESLQVRRESITNMLAEINAIYPHAELTFQDISFYHAGLLPMKGCTENGDIQLEKHSAIQVNEREHKGRILSVRGVKYTTAPFIALKVIRYLLTKESPMRSVENRTSDSRTKGTETSVRLRHLGKRYGGRAARVETYISAGEEPLVTDEEMPLFRGEVRYLVENEMAKTLADVIFRRTELGTLRCPSHDLLDELSIYMAGLLGWDEQTRKTNVDNVKIRYSPLAPE